LRLHFQRCKSGKPEVFRMRHFGTNAISIRRKYLPGLLPLPQRVDNKKRVDRKEVLVYYRSEL
jgi:hypothetical protein